MRSRLLTILAALLSLTACTTEKVVQVEAPDVVVQRSAQDRPDVDDRWINPYR
jgi:hypothetical protein